MKLLTAGKAKNDIAKIAKKDAMIFPILQYSFIFSPKYFIILPCYRINITVTNCCNGDYSPPDTKLIKKLNIYLTALTIMHRHKIQNDYHYLLLLLIHLFFHLFLQCKQDNYRKLTQEIRYIMS
jgi:hypothetical protein